MVANRSDIPEKNISIYTDALKLAYSDGAMSDDGELMLESLRSRFEITDELHDELRLEVFAYLAELHKEEGSIKEALKWYKALTDIDENDEYAWRQMGIIYTERNDYQLAGRALKKAHQISERARKDLKFAEQIEKKLEFYKNMQTERERSITKRESKTKTRRRKKRREVEIVEEVPELIDEPEIEMDDTFELVDEEEEAPSMDFEFLPPEDEEMEDFEEDEEDDEEEEEIEIDEEDDSGPRRRPGGRRRRHEPAPPPKDENEDDEKPKRRPGGRRRRERTPPPEEDEERTRHRSDERKRRHDSTSSSEETMKSRKEGRRRRREPSPPPEEEEETSEPQKRSRPDRKKDRPKKTGDDEKKEEKTDTMKCPKCRSIVVIPSKKRPIIVKCEKCGASGKLMK